jgi:hypothetical protein
MPCAAAHQSGTRHAHVGCDRPLAHLLQNFNALPDERPVANLAVVEGSVFGQAVVGESQACARETAGARRSPQATWVASEPYSNQITWWPERAWPCARKHAKQGEHYAPGGDMHTERGGIHVRTDSFAMESMQAGMELSAAIASVP